MVVQHIPHHDPHLITLIQNPGYGPVVGRFGILLILNICFLHCKVQVNVLCTMTDQLVSN